MKKLFFTKPLAIACALFLSVLFVFLLFCIPYGILFAVISFLISFLLILFLIIRKKSKFCRLFSLLLVCTLFLSAAFLHAGSLSQERNRIRESYHDKTYPAEFLVHTVTHYEKVSRIDGVFTEIAGNEEKIKGSLVLFVNGKLDTDELKAGDLLTGSFQLESTEKEGLTQLGNIADGVYLNATSTFDCQKTGERKETLAVRLQILRAAFSALLEDTLTDRGAAMMKALLLSDKSGIDSDVKEGFSVLGISHLFAVSGLHLSILMGFFAFLFEKLKVGRRITYPVLAVITVFYMTLTGFAPSMMRSGGMLLLFYLSWFSKRKRDSVTSLFVATSIITLISPTSVLDVGLLMSFSATLGILLIASPCMNRITQMSIFKAKSRLGKLTAYGVKQIVSAIVLSLSANAAILPLIHVMKERVFALSFLSNLVFTPLFSLLLFLLPLFLLLVPFSPLVKVFSFVIDKLTAAIYAMALWGKGMKPLSFSLSYWFIPIFMILLFVCLGYLLWKKKNPYLPMATITAFLLVAVLGITLHNVGLKDRESVSYATDGSNDRIEITYGRKGLLLDFSSSASFLKNGCDNDMAYSPSVTLDTLMLTSCRAIHISALTALLEDGMIQNLILPKYENTEDEEDGAINYAHTFAALAQESGVTVTFYQPGDTVFWNGIAIKTYPDGTKKSVTAADIQLANTTLLYIRENAPMLYDIRFGPLSEHRDVIFFGNFGNPPQGYPFVFHADTVVMGGDTHYVKKTDGTEIVYESPIFTDSRPS